MTAPTISAPELVERLSDPKTRILDVRTGAEFETAHIPGSYNVPLDTLQEHARELAATDAPVVVVCQSGSRASQACVDLTVAGREDLQILDGGIASWQKVGGDVVRGEQRWGLERQVRLVAGSMVLAGVLSSIAVPKAKWLAGAVGAGLAFSAVSDTCAMGEMLAKLKYNRTEPIDIHRVLEHLRSAA